MSDLLRKFQNLSKKSALLFVLLLQGFIISAARADILYIGDTTFDDVAQELQQRASEYQNYGQILNYTDKGSGIANYQNWLYASTGVQDSSQIDAIVISLGIVDFSQSRKNAPSDNQLEQGIYEILQQVNTGAPVFWILPHAYMPNNATQTEIWQSVVAAVMRAYTSGDWPTLYVVNLEEWAMYSEVSFTDLLTRKQDGFSRTGAAKVADIVLHYLFNPPAENP